MFTKKQIITKILKFPPKKIFFQNFYRNHPKHRQIKNLRLKKSSSQNFKVSDFRYVFA